MKEVICVICPKSCHIHAQEYNGQWEIRGNSCKRGLEFALSEVIAPKRSLTTTVKTIYDALPLLPVKTDRDIPLSKLIDAVKEINKTTITQRVFIGEILIQNILDTGANIIATSDII